MGAREVLQRILNEKYQNLKKINPRVSKRSFGKKIGVSPGAISELLSGRRKVSFKLAKRLSEKLNLDPQERYEFLSLYDDGSGPSGDIPEPNYLQLSADQFSIIAEWYHFAFLTLMKTTRFTSDFLWISKRLGISIADVKGTVERLKRVNILTEDPSGNLKREPGSFRTSDDIANSSVHKAHQQYLLNARSALDRYPVTERDFTSVILMFGHEDLIRAKEMIRKFQDDFCATFENSPKSDVFQLAIQLFPLTQKEFET